MADLIQLKVSELHPHPDNPRKEIGDVTELADSIKANGIFQNLTVVPRAEGGYTVIIGHRRLTAAKQAGLETVPCVIAEMSDEEQLQTMLLENMQRSDLTIYEQAKGFQMLLDFGKSVDEIAEKSGFSKTTIRRRLKMNELDQHLLKKVTEERQINLMDFDELNKIEDPEARNVALKEIGTTNFAYKVKSLLRDQAVNKYKADALEMMKERGIVEIASVERYNSDRYRSICRIMIEKWPEQRERCPEKGDYDKMAYCFESYTGCIEIYEKRKVERKPVDEEKKKRDAAIKQAWEYIYQQANICYELRRDFVRDLTLTAKNRDIVLEGAFMVGALNIMTHNNKADTEAMDNIIGATNERGDWKKKEIDILEKLKVMDEENLPKMVCAMFGDTNRRLMANYYTNNWPTFTPDAQIQLLYHWLEMLGYEMCSIEKELVYGTAKIYENPYANK